ncbi:uncharacterized protein [Cicer arietinum]|uniref:uncharacterized protein n=1 Tax=Cicer arietinum TaxID=3827 RepID=UPI003CC50B49
MSIQFKGTMTSTKYVLEKFNRNNDFGLWRLKMKALLVHQGLERALGGDKDMASPLPEREKKDIMDKTHNALILSLGDKILREVSKETSTTEEVQVALISKELKRKSNGKEESSGEGLFVKAKEGKKNKKKKNKFKNKENDKSKMRCFICKKEGPFKKDCPNWK